MEKAIASITLDTRVNTPYHRGVTRMFFAEHAIKEAFEIMTGKVADAAADEYAAFVAGLVASGNIQEKYFPTYRELLQAGLKVYAVQSYWKATGRESLANSRKIIDEWEQALKNQQPKGSEADDQ